MMLGVQGNGTAKMAERLRREQAARSEQPRFTPKYDPQQAILVRPGVAVVVESDGERDTYLYDGWIHKTSNLPTLKSCSPLGAALFEKMEGDLVSYEVNGTPMSARLITIIAGESAVDFVTRQKAPEISTAQAAVATVLEYLPKPLPAMQRQTA